MFYKRITSLEHTVMVWRMLSAQSSTEAFMGVQR